MAKYGLCLYGCLYIALRNESKNLSSFENTAKFGNTTFMFCRDLYLNANYTIRFYLMCNRLPISYSL